ncbi:MAG: hypothetical protein JWO76_1093 [Nocardioides sp.]|nr:hypothetical protein [Nocardioides sp.]
MRPSLARVGVVPALLVALLAAGCGGPQDDARRLATGEVVPVFGTMPETVRASVPLPSGELVLALDADASGRQDTGASRPVVAGGGDHLLGLAWSRSDSDLDPLLHEVLTGRTLEDAGAIPDVAVVVGDERYPLSGVGTPGQQHGALWVALPDGTATIEVSYDGLTQTVDLDTGTVDSGVAAPLADPTALQHDGSSCDPADFPPGDVLSVECTVERWFAVPYVDQLGWAPEGRTWVVTDTIVEGDPTMTLDGKRGKAVPSTTAVMERTAFLVPTRDSYRLSFDFGARIGTHDLHLS